MQHSETSLRLCRPSADLSRQGGLFVALPLETSFPQNLGRPSRAILACPAVDLALHSAKSRSSQPSCAHAKTDLSTVLFCKLFPTVSDTA